MSDAALDLLCVLPDGHPLLAKRVIHLKDFADQPFISMASNDPYQLQLDTAFAQANVTRRLVAEAPTTVSVCSLVRHGLGIAIVNPLTALDFAGRGLQIRRLAAAFPFRVSLIHPEHRPGNQVVPAFIASIQDEASALRRRLAPKR